MFGDPILEERFWKKVEVQAGGCWLWTAAKNADGYGRYSIGGQDNRQLFQAHRVAYEALVTDIPAGLQLDHLCRTPACVNPDHLEVVTNQENARRSLLVGRKKDPNKGSWQRAKTHCPQGHPFDEDNTYRYPSGARACRTCRRLRWDF
jgi:hypothetical protein